MVAQIHFIHLFFVSLVGSPSSKPSYLGRINAITSPITAAPAAALWIATAVRSRWVTKKVRSLSRSWRVRRQDSTEVEGRVI